jgi:DNA-binding GntR family transcriptional regulator
MDNHWTIPETEPWSIPIDARKSWDQRIPYYVRIRDHLAALIDTGALAPGAKLPPERALQGQFKVTRNTIRQALMQMETEGLAYRERRRGWFVSPPRITYDPTTNASFTESVARQGRVPGTEVLSKERIVAGAWEAVKLGCAIGDPAFLVRRLRSVDGRVVLIEHLYVNAVHCPDLLDFPLDSSLTRFMSEHYGIIECRTRVSMRPTAMPKSQAQALDVAVGMPSLCISREIRDQFDRIIEFDQEFWRHDALEINVDLHQPHSAPIGETRYE